MVMHNSIRFKKQLIFLLVGLIGAGGCFHKKNEKVKIVGPAQAVPVKIIFDTDMGPDYDDVGALAVLHALANKNEADILATMASNKDSLVAPVIDLINTFYNRPDLPIGVPKSSGVSMGSSFHWPEYIVGKYPHDLKNNNQAPDAVALYRKILTSQKSKSVTIVTVGFLTNLANLLQSKPDVYSTLNGTDLVNEKVKKLVVMGGQFPGGREFNFYMDSVSTQYVTENWPTTVIFSGFEIGNEILTGDELIQKKEEGNPVKDVYAFALELEEASARMSWDQTAVLTAVRGNLDYFEVVPGFCDVDENGNNTWQDSVVSKHLYLKEKMPFKAVEDTIEKYMSYTPD